MTCSCSVKILDTTPRVSSNQNQTVLHTLTVGTKINTVPKTYWSCCKPYPGGDKWLEVPNLQWLSMPVGSVSI